jgi:CRISPR/Cas system-associated protein Cas5 (RAMP superfamily)
MFDNELMSDISFICGKPGESSRIFHAHKYVLATSSAVFYAMFYGNLADKKSLICRIEDAKEESFKEFLRFLYTDNCKITSAENTKGVLYLAKKYLISSLAEKCCKVLETSIKPDNVFAVLEQAIQFDEKELEAKCWRVISLQTRECVNSEAFCDIASCTLNPLLKRETLTITEVELLKGVLRWADSECARQGIFKKNKMARRRVLGDNVHEIRFLAMSQEDFAKYVSTTGILTDAEIVCIYKKFSGLDVAGLKWKQEKRQLFIVGISRSDLANVGDCWDYDGNRSDALTLTVNKSVLFHGVRLLGDSRGSQYEVKFAIKDENVTGTFISEEDDDDVWGYDVMLPKPICLLPNEKITIITTIKGPDSHKVWNGESSMSVDDIVVTFEDAPSGLSSNGTNGTEGQFYKIFLCEL